MSQTLPKAEGLKVLVVDDELVLCQSVEKILKRKGHKVDAVTSVADALKSLDSGSRYDLIIADLMMPQAGGMELLSAVQGSWPELPVLIITGFSSPVRLYLSIKSFPFFIVLNHNPYECSRYLSTSLPVMDIV